MSRHIFHIAPKRSGHAFIGYMIKEWCEECTYHDFENVLPRVFNSRYTADLNTIVVVQTRDFLNWFASYYMMSGKINIGMCRVWKEITVEYYKPFYLRKFKPVRICYDTFTYNKEYRRQLCQQLNGVYSEKMLRRVMHNGGGSSFDKREYDFQAQKMNVLDRYKEIPADVFVKLFKKEPGLLKFYRKHSIDKKKLEYLDQILS